MLISGKWTILAQFGTKIIQLYMSAYALRIIGSFATSCGTTGRQKRNSEISPKKTPLMWGNFGPIWINYFQGCTLGNLFELVIMIGYNMFIQVTCLKYLKDAHFGINR